MSRGTSDLHPGLGNVLGSPEETEYARGLSPNRGGQPGVLQHEAFFLFVNGTIEVQGKVPFLSAEALMSSFACVLKLTLPPSLHSP